MVELCYSEVNFWWSTKRSFLKTGENHLTSDSFANLEYSFSYINFKQFWCA